METRFGSPPRSHMARGSQRSMPGSTVEDQTRPNGARQRDTTVPSSVGFEDSSMMPSISSYRDYPPTKPFIKDTYTRPSEKPVKAYPESNRQAVMSALKGLQDKIRSLEVERSHAEKNLQTLASETSRYRDILQNNDQSIQYSPSVSINQQTSPKVQPSSRAEVESQFSETEKRCRLLEKQLEYMRKMVQSAESDKADSIRRSMLLRQESRDAEEEDIKLQLRKIQELEREHLKLNATQTLAECKIRELEEKLMEEKHHRKLMHERAAEVADQDGTSRSIKKKKKKKVVTKPKTKRVPASSSNPREHYRLNLKEIPFVAGKSVTDSHSVPANVQKVLSLMKFHSPVLCNGASPRSGGYYHQYGCHMSSSSSGVSSRSNSSDLGDLLLQLQDEFGQMSFEHQELNRQINEATDPHLQDDLERELDHLVSKMEVKGDQIAKIRRHQELVDEKLKKKKKKTKPAGSASQSRVHNRSQTANIPLTGEVQVTTTIRSKPKGHVCPATGITQYVNPGSTFQSREFLKNLKKIQTTLRKEDLSWDE